MRSRNVLTLVALALFALVVAGCTLNANPGTTPAVQETPTGEVLPTFPPELLTPTVAAGEHGAGEEVATAAPTKVPVVPTVISTAATSTPVPSFTPAPTATTVPATAVPSGEILYTVKEGDNLFRIALAYNLTWRTVAEYNGIVNPNWIFVGQVIKIPPSGSGATPVPPSGKTHVVQVGENLFRIALAYGLPYTTVAAYNGIPYPYFIYPGQVIYIP